MPDFIQPYVCVRLRGVVGWWGGGDGAGVVEWWGWRSSAGAGWHEWRASVAKLTHRKASLVFLDHAEPEAEQVGLRGGGLTWSMCGG